MTHSINTAHQEWREHHLERHEYVEGLVDWLRFMTTDPDQEPLRAYLRWACARSASVERICDAVATRAASILSLDRLEPLGRQVLATVDHLHEPVAKQLTVDPCFIARYALARNKTLNPALLRKLAQDPDDLVQLSVAENPNTDASTQLLLAANTQHLIVRMTAEAAAASSP